jgi:hypothetical protein
VDPRATGKPLSTLNALLDMNAGYLRSAVVALAIVVVVVWLDFRSLTDALLAMLPLAIGCVNLFGAMSWLGLDLNPANMIVLPLILGIGIDYGIHVVHDFRLSRGTYEIRWGLAKALCMTSGTTILSFGTLLVGRHWGMASIGLTMGLGVSACTLTALTLLVATLHWRSRRRPTESATEGDPLPSTVHYQEAA